MAASSCKVLGQFKAIGGCHRIKCWAISTPSAFVFLQNAGPIQGCRQVSPYKIDAGPFRGYRHLCSFKMLGQFKAIGRHVPVNSWAISRLSAFVFLQNAGPIQGCRQACSCKSLGHFEAIGRCRHIKLMLGHFEAIDICVPSKCWANSRLSAGMFL